MVSQNHDTRTTKMEATPFWKVIGGKREQLPFNSGEKTTYIKINQEHKDPRNHSTLRLNHGKYQGKGKKDI